MLFLYTFIFDIKAEEGTGVEPDLPTKKHNVDQDLVCRLPPTSTPYRLQNVKQDLDNYQKLYVWIYCHFWMLC